jgi:hypothetical protein
MGLLKALKNFRGKNKSPEQEPSKYLEEVQRDNYTFTLLERIQKEIKRLDTKDNDKV